MVVGLGYENFLKQLINRSKNENRARPNPLKRRLIVVEDEKPHGKNDQYGCVNWQPPIENEDDIRVIKNQAAAKSCEEFSTEEIETFIEQTFPLQRPDINANKSIVESMVEWPLLFTKPGLLRHFTELTGVDLMEYLIYSLKKKCDRILAYFSKGLNSDKIYQIQEIYHARKVLNTEQPVVFGIIFLVMKYFDEEAEILFHIVDEHTRSSDIDISILPVGPFLICYGESLLLAKKMSLVVDGKVILEDIYSILEAVALLFASFYCFNIQYPEKSSNTLEFIQRCFVGINPDYGTKASKDKKKKGKSYKTENALIDI